MMICRCTAALVVALSMCACESPFVDSADRSAYSLVAQRQRQVLGGTSEVTLDRPVVPIPVDASSYDLMPPTQNTAPSPVTSVSGAAAPGTRPASGTSESDGAQSESQLEALLARVPALDLGSQGELPPFPTPLPDGKSRLVFTLNDCFNYALENSREYRTRKEDLYIAALSVALARHQFEPRFFGTTSMGVSGRGEASDYAAAFSATQSLGVRQRLPMGGEVVASALVSAVDQIRGQVSDGLSADLTLQANIPLLRGAGLEGGAQASLIQAERSLIYEVRTFERFRRAFLVQVASNYFNLVNQRAQVVNRYRSVESYIFITQRTQALFEAGLGRRRVSQLDLQRAQQSEFQARNDLTNAIQQYELSLDSFKILLGMSAAQGLDVTPQYLNIEPPTTTEAAAVQLALSLRLDLQTTRDRVDDSLRQYRLAANNLLPNLDFSARLGASSDPSRRTLAADNPDYSLGLTLELPLDRVAEQNALRTALINVSRSKRNVEQAEDQVAIDVRDALRRVRQQEFLVSLQRVNIDLASQRKEFADIQFRNGEIDNRDYLDAETALLDAQNRLAQSISSLVIATLQFLRDTDQLRVDEHGRLLLPASVASPDAAMVPPSTPQRQG